MKNKDQLLQLIHSLSKSEKSHFYKNINFINVNKPKKYLLLFQAIDNFKGESIDDLRESIEDAEIRQYFNQYKKYLFDILLENLQSFWRLESTILKISSLTSDALLLEQKMLFKSAIRYASKAYDLAHKSNEPGFLLLSQQIIIRCKTRLLGNISLNAANKYLSYWDEFAELDYELRSLRHLAFFENSILAALNNRHLHKTPGYAQYLKEVADRADKYKLDWNLESRLGKIFSSLSAIYLSAIPQLPSVLEREISLEDLNSVVKLIDDEYIEYNLHGSIIDLYNIGVFAKEQKYSELVLICAERLLAISSRSEIIKETLINKGLTLYIDGSLIDKKNIFSPLKIIEKYKWYIDSCFKKQKNEEDYFALFLALSCIYYKKGNYKEALRYNNILSFGNISSGSIVHYKSIILNLLICYQRGEVSFDYIHKHINKISSENGWDTLFIDTLIDLLVLLVSSGQEKEIHVKCDLLVNIIENSDVQYDNENAIATLCSDIDLIEWINSLKNKFQIKS